MHLKNVSLGISLAVQWFRLYFHGRGMAFICGGELRFHMLCTIAKRKLKKKKISLVNIHCAGKGPKREVVSSFQLRNAVTLCEDMVDTEVERESRHVKGEGPMTLAG